MRRTTNASYGPGFILMTNRGGTLDSAESLIHLDEALRLVYLLKLAKSKAQACFTSVPKAKALMEALALLTGCKVQKPK